MEVSTELYETAAYPARYSGPADEALAWLICILAFFSNSLTIVTMVKQKRMVGQKARIYIVALAVSDLLMTPTLLLELILSRTGHLFMPIFTQVDSKIVKYERVVNIILSMMYLEGLVTNLFTLLAVAVDRLVALVKPLKYRTWFTDFRIKLMLVAVWIYVLVVGSLMFSINKWSY